MNRQTLISMIITIILFVASIALIAFGVNMILNPVTYHYSHGFFSYYVSYSSSHASNVGGILFTLGRSLLICSFVMLGFTIYFSSSKKDEKRECVDRKEERKRVHENVIDASYCEGDDERKE